MLVQREMESGRSPLVSNCASVGGTRKQRTASATGFEMKSGWPVSSNHAQLLGKESITARFRTLRRRTVLVNASGCERRVLANGAAFTGPPVAPARIGDWRQDGSNSVSELPASFSCLQ